jgi:hypothetical protein
MLPIHFSRGARITDAHPIQVTAPNFDAFADAVLSDRAPAKGLQYISLPMRANGDGRAHRINENALPSAFIPFDFDGFADPGAYGHVLTLLSQFKGFGYTTASHTPEAPRARHVLAANRDMTPIERKRVCLALQAWLESQVGPGRINFDQSVYNPAQALYCPPVGAEVYKFDGMQVDVDHWLQYAPPVEEKPGARERAERIATNDPVLKRLYERGMVLRQLEPGQYAVQCPGGQHDVATGNDTSTVYWLPNHGGFKDGKFACLHAKCEGREQADFLQALDLNPGKIWQDNRLPDATKVGFGGSLPVAAAFSAPLDEDPFSWTEELTMTDAEIEELADPEWIYENLLIQGHLIALPAEPNAGKTTILEWVCGQISDAYRVIYVNADISGSDAKYAYQKAKRGGYTLLLPDMKQGGSMDYVVTQLEAMNRSGAELADAVMVFDTLKKMVDVINKARARELYKLLRSLTAKGMTIVLLAHTNKHKGDDGKPIFEGTGDLRSDVDEMIYLIPMKHEDGSMTVSTAPDKVRGNFQPISFEISADRQVSRKDGFVDVARERLHQKQREDDADDIAIINALLSRGEKTQSEIVKHCKDENIGRRRVLSLLKRYTRGNRALWQCRQERKNNVLIYATVPSIGVTSGTP